MRNKAEKINIPEHVSVVIRRLRESGYEAYAVGGCVRDTILGRPVHDWDVATSAPPVEIARHFEKTVKTGERYGGITVRLPEYGSSVEVTAFRTDGAYSDGRHPESVKFGVKLTDDLSRRDFTMNAMAVSEHGGIIDPFNGQGDIENRIIRSVGDPARRFSEDALRMLRALRFSAELDFTIEPATKAAIEEYGSQAEKLSAERVRDELGKTLQTRRPEKAGEMLRLGLLTGRVSETSAALDFTVLKELPEEVNVRWCAFCVILEEAGAIGTAAEFLRKMRHPNKMVKQCALGTELVRTEFSEDRTGIKRAIAERGTEAVLCAAAVKDAMNGGGRTGQVMEILQSGECYSLNTLAVTGEDLKAHGYPADEKLGAMLRGLLAHVIERPADNTREVLLMIADSERGKGA